MKALIQALEERKTAEAIALANTLDSQPDNMTVRSLALRSAAFKLAGKHEIAYKLLVEALNQKPDNLSLQNNMATLLEAMGRTDEAINLLEKITIESPEFKDAKNNLASLRNKLESRRLPSAEMRQEAITRLCNPLIAAFAANEVEQNKKTRNEAQKRRRNKKLQAKPSLPKLDDSVVAEEWLLAAGDALRCGAPKESLELCNIALQNGAPIGNCYALAGDAYIALKNGHASHLCYLLAGESGNLGTEQQLNLIALALEIGDHSLATRRLEQLKNLPSDSPLKERINKLYTKYPSDAIKVTFEEAGLKRHEKIKTKQNA